MVKAYEMKEGTPIVLDPRCAHEVFSLDGNPNQPHRLHTRWLRKAIV